MPRRKTSRMNRIRKFLPRIVSLVQHPSIRTPFYAVKEHDMAKFSEAFPLGGDSVESFKDGAPEDAGQKALDAAVEALVAWKDDCPPDVQNSIGVLAHLIDGALAAQKAACPKCGEEVPEGVEVCPKCGAEMAPEVAADDKEGEGAPVPPPGDGKPAGAPAGDEAIANGLGQVKAGLAKLMEAIDALTNMSQAGKSEDLDVEIDVAGVGATGTLKLSEVMGFVDQQIDAALGKKGGN